MAAPILTVTRTPEGVVAPGTQVSFTVTATDSDARSLTYTFTGTDGTGAAATITNTVIVGDPVTVAATVTDPEDTATLNQDLTNPNVWHSVV